MTLEELEKLKRVFSGHSSANGELEHDELLRSLGLEPGIIYQELEMTSRFADIRRDVSHTNAEVSLHSHDFYEVICCHTVVDVEYLIGSERYRLKPGDIIFIPPGMSHRPLLPKSMTEPYRRDVLWLSTALIQNLCQFYPSSFPLILQESQLLRTYGTQWESLCSHFTNLLQESALAMLGWEALVIAHSIQFLVQFFRAVTEHTTLPTKTEKPELLDRVINYIETNLDKRITLAETAQLFFVSESTISQTFRNKMGVSFYRYVTQRRLITAKSLIARDLPLETIAEMVGFTEYSSFYRAFKQEYGISPRQFRNMRE